MLRSKAAGYGEIRAWLDEVPVIETHEHYAGIVGPVEDALGFVAGDYIASDLQAAAYGREHLLPGLMKPGVMPEEERQALFRELYGRSGKTAYARGMQEGLRACWGIEDIAADGALAELEQKLKGRDQAFYERMMEKNCIRAAIVDIFDLEPFVNAPGAPYSKYCRFAFSLPAYHDLRDKPAIQRLNRYAGRTITCLDDYLEGFENYLKKCIDFGVVCFKDQTAYRRTIAYSNPTRAEAEKAFNDIVSDPRGGVGDERARALDDWLFHYFMRLAARHNLPVQLHTGHMAGIRNDIVKTNAALLTSVLELHEDVRFDLFHGNWPYMGEYLFLGKNYPNVWLNLCWVQVVDPIYSIELMKRAVMTVPHAKVFAFGGDTGHIEWATGYLKLARDNVACALSELVDEGWLDMGEARQIAADWFYNNPNQFFNLGLEPYKP